MKTIDIKGKPYVMAHERIKYFRENYPSGQILTDLISDVDGKCIFKTEILVDGECVATGYAYEREDSTFINKTSYIENCETSSIARALGVAGIGIDNSVASFEEVANAISNQKYDDGVQFNSQPESLGDEYINFGKNKGKKWTEVEDHFLEWIINNFDKPEVVKLASAEIEHRLSQAEEGDNFIEERLNNFED